MNVTTFTEIVLPNHANPLGYLKGGKLMDWMDIAAEIAAQKYTKTVSVTVAVDNITFKHPIKIGDIVTIHARITRTFDSSMEVWVQVWKENYMKTNEQSQEKMKTNEAFFIFVAINEKGNHIRIPVYKPVSDEDKILYENALKRKNRLSLLTKSGV